MPPISNSPSSISSDIPHASSNRPATRKRKRISSHSLNTADYEDKDFLELQGNVSVSASEGSLTPKDTKRSRRKRDEVVSRIDELENESVDPITRIRRKSKGSTSLLARMNANVRKTTGGTSRSSGKSGTQKHRKKRHQDTPKEINKNCERIIEGLIALTEDDEDVWEFVRPVSTKVYRDYSQVVSHPICLEEMQKKAEGYEYKSYEDLHDDLELMLKNGRTYQKYLGFPKPGRPGLGRTMAFIKDQATLLLFKHCRLSKKFDVNLEDLMPLEQGVTGAAAPIAARVTAEKVGKHGLTYQHFSSIGMLSKMGIMLVSSDPMLKEELGRLFRKLPPLPTTYQDACRPSKEVGMKYALLDIEEKNLSNHEGIIQAHYATKPRSKRNKTSSIKLKPYQDIVVHREESERYSEWKKKSKQTNVYGEKLALEYEKKFFPHWYFMQRFSMRSIILHGLGCLYELTNRYWVQTMKQLLIEQKKSEEMYFAIVAGYHETTPAQQLFRNLLTRIAEDVRNTPNLGVSLAHLDVKASRSTLGYAEKLVELLDVANNRWISRRIPKAGERIQNLARSWAERTDPDSGDEKRFMIFILIHQVDGPALRNEEFQRALTTLMDSPHVSCVLTYANIYSRLMYDQHMASAGRPYFCDCTTMRPFEVGNSDVHSKHQTQSDSFEIFKTNLSGMTKNVQDFITSFVLRYSQFEKTGANINELVDFCREEQTLQTWVGDYSKLENILLEPLENKMLRKRNQRYYLNVNKEVIEQLQAYFRRVDADDD